MTMPHMMNCSHSSDGWCLDCVANLVSTHEGELARAKELHNLHIRRTGNIYSIASSEFEISYPDGTRGTVWSPPWHELSPEDEETSAKEVAMARFISNKHRH